VRPDEVRRLLGGYATGTLTDDERTLLFSAALEDQSLFDALADEEALRELLADPLVRGELLAELDPPPANEARPWEGPVTGSLAASSSATPASSAAPALSASMIARPVTVKASESAWASFVRVLTPRRMAIAGAFAALIVVIGGVRYLRQSDAEGNVELARNQNPMSTSLPDRLPAPPLAPAGPSPKSVEGTQAENALKRSREFARAAREERKDSGPAEPAASAPSAPPQVAVAPPPPPPARELAPAPVVEFDKLADERRDAEPSAASLARGAIGTEKDAEKKAEQASAAPAGAPQTAAVRSAPPAVAMPAPPPLPAPTKARPSRNQAAANQAVNEQGSARQTPGIAGGFGGRLAAPPQDRLKQMNAQVTDINGTIVSISVGTNAGLKRGDTLEIVRAGRAIGTVRLTEAGETFAVGPFSPAPGGPAVPRAGDFAQTPQPVKP